MYRSFISASISIWVGCAVIGLTSLAPAQTSVGQSQENSGTRDLLQRAVQYMDAGRNREAASQLSELVTIVNGDMALEARYQFAKALYRMRFLHAALGEFKTVLAQGPDTPYYRASLEWCLFIGRKMADDVAVNEVLVTYGDNQFPDRYRDEFMFQLARYHYTRALFESPIVEPIASPVVEKAEGISFEDDVFGDKARKREKAAEDEALKFGDDLFGDESPPPQPKRPKKAKKDQETLRFGDDLFEDAPSDQPGVSMTPEQRYGLARQLLERVAKTSEFYPKAQFLRGLLMVQAGKENAALKAFKEVIEVTQPINEKRSESEMKSRERLRELAFFQLARLHFGAKQPSFSIFYYRRVDRNSLQWLDALYEASWAEYRLGRYERALGNLLTVHSPFFEDAYFPESVILKAVIYYENCRYAEAERIIEDFLARYEPLFRALDQLSGRQQGPEEWYRILSSQADVDWFSQTNDNRLVQQVVSVVLGDPEVRRLNLSVREVEREFKRLGDEAQSPLFSERAYISDVLARLESVKATLVRRAGAAVERKLKTEAQAVKVLVAQAIRVQVETAKAEEGRLEASLRQRAQRPRNVRKTSVDWTDDEKLVWPFEGEYWRDELGTYELTLASSCR